MGKPWTPEQHERFKATLAAKKGGVAANEEQPRKRRSRSRRKPPVEAPSVVVVDDGVFLSVNGRRYPIDDCILIHAVVTKLRGSNG